MDTLRSLTFMFNAAGEGSVKETVSSISSDNDQIILALIAIIATSIAALVYTIRNNTLAKGAAQDASDINKAVNNIGPGEHRLYDMIVHIKDDVQHFSNVISEVKEDVQRLTNQQDEFSKKGWATLPPDLASASGLTEVIREIQHDAKDLHSKIDFVIKSLQDHVEWEMSQKYHDNH